MTPRYRHCLRTVLALTMLANASGALAQGPDGKQLFETHCQKCHGPSGRPSAGIRKLLPEIPVWDAAFFAKRTDEDIVSVLRNGKGKNMKPFSDRLKPEEMAAVARYIRTLTP